MSDQSEINRTKQIEFVDRMERQGLKAVKIFVSYDSIELAKKIFIPKDDGRKNVQRDAVTRAFKAGLVKNTGIEIKPDYQLKNEVHIATIDKKQALHQVALLRSENDAFTRDLRTELSKLKLELREAQNKINELQAELVIQPKPILDKTVSIDRCECLTAKGTQCKSVVNLSYLGRQGAERMVCNLHLKQYRRGFKLKFIEG